MLPNVFPGTGDQAEYNTADASLWFFEAWRAYISETGDMAALRDLIAERLGIDSSLLAKAFTVTRPLRGVGMNHDVRGDMAQVLVAAGVDPAPALVDELVTLERHELDRGVHLYDDVIPALGELRSRGVKTALVSNCSNNTRPVVDRMGLGSEFDVLILSFEVGARKPLPEIYGIALERLNVDDPSRALFVDDQPEYCDGAAAVGLDTRLIVRPDQEPPTDTHGHAVIVNLTDLLGSVRKSPQR
jgi:putative hydrolase of the HAD superfamily